MEAVRENFRRSGDRGRWPYHNSPRQNRQTADWPRQGEKPAIIGGVDLTRQRPHGGQRRAADPIVGSWRSNLCQVEQHGKVDTGA